MFHGKKSFKETFKKGFKRLVLPFVFFSVIGELIYILRQVLEQRTIIIYDFIKSELIGSLAHGYLIGNAPLWFLLSLFVIRCIFTIPKSHIGYCAILVVSLIVSILMHIVNPPIVWLMNIPMGLFFYSAGYQLFEKQYRRSIFIVSLICLILIATFCDSEVSIIRLMTIFGNFYIWILYALVAVIVANNLFKKLGDHFDIKYLNWLGKNSMLIYVSHGPFFNLIHSVCLTANVSNPYIMLTIMMVGTSIVIFGEYMIIKKYKLEYLIGG